MNHEGTITRVIPSQENSAPATIDDRQREGAHRPVEESLSPALISCEGDSAVRQPGYVTKAELRNELRAVVDPHVAHDPERAVDEPERLLLVGVLGRRLAHGHAEGDAAAPNHALP